MKKTLATMLLFTSVTLWARDVRVVLEAPDNLVTDYSAALNFALYLSDGSLLGLNLFTSEDFKKGVKQKTLHYDDNLTVSKCAFTWAIMNHPPRLPGEPERNLPELLMPERFDGGVDGTCQLNEQTNEIGLTPAPFVFKPMTIQFDPDALKNHKASQGFANARPLGVNDTYRHLSTRWNGSSQKQAPAPVTAWVLSRELVKFRVDTLWITRGGAVQGSHDFEENVIVIR